MFISIIYMFRAAMCPVSGELIVIIDIWCMSPCIDNRLECRFGWECVSSTPAHQTVIYTEWHIPDVVLIRCWTHGCPKHEKNRNKHTWKRIVREVGYLQRSSSTFLNGWSLKVSQRPVWNDWVEDKLLRTATETVVV